MMCCGLVPWDMVSDGRLGQDTCYDMGMGIVTVGVNGLLFGRGLQVMWR